MKRLTKSEEVALLRIANQVMPFTAIHGDKHARWVQVASALTDELRCPQGVISERLCRDVTHRLLKNFQEKHKESGPDNASSVDNGDLLDTESMEERDQLCAEIQRKITIFRSPFIIPPGEMMAHMSQRQSVSLPLGHVPPAASSGNEPRATSGCAGSSITNTTNTTNATPTPMNSSAVSLPKMGSTNNSNKNGAVNGHLDTTFAVPTSCASDLDAMRSNSLPMGQTGGNLHYPLSGTYGYSASRVSVPTGNAITPTNGRSLSPSDTPGSDRADKRDRDQHCDHTEHDGDDAGADQRLMSKRRRSSAALYPHDTNVTMASVSSQLPDSARQHLVASMQRSTPMSAAKEYACQQMQTAGPGSGSGSGSDSVPGAVPGSNTSSSRFVQMKYFHPHQNPGHMIATTPSSYSYTRTSSYLPSSDRQMMTQMQATADDDTSHLIPIHHGSTNGYSRISPSGSLGRVSSLQVLRDPHAIVPTTTIPTGSSAPSSSLLSMPPPSSFVSATSGPNSYPISATLPLPMSMALSAGTPITVLAASSQQQYVTQQHGSQQHFQLTGRVYGNGSGSVPGNSNGQSTGTKDSGENAVPLASLLDMMATTIRNQSEQIRTLQDQHRRDATDRQFIVASMRLIMDRLGIPPTMVPTINSTTTWLPPIKPSSTPPSLATSPSHKNRTFVSLSPRIQPLAQQMALTASMLPPINDTGLAFPQPTTLSASHPPASRTPTTLSPKTLVAASAAPSAVTTLADSNTVIPMTCTPSTTVSEVVSSEAAAVVASTVANESPVVPAFDTPTLSAAANTLAGMSETTANIPMQQ